MDKIMLAIKDYEYITAGRFYNYDQKNKIFNLIAKANLLDDNEYKMLLKMLFKDEVYKCNRIQDCKNQKILMMLTNQDEYLLKILEERIEVLDKNENYSKLKDYEEWLEYINKDNVDIDDTLRLMDISILCYLKNDLQESLNSLDSLIKKRNLKSIKISRVICEKLENKKLELKYLVLYLDLIKNIYNTDITINYKLYLNNFSKDDIDKMTKQIQIEEGTESKRKNRQIGFNK